MHRPSLPAGPYLRYVALLLVTAAARPGAAQSSASELERLRLSVAAPAACVSATTVAERVAARSTRISFVEADADVPRLQVTIRPRAANDVSADLTVQMPSGRRSRRHLAARSCAEAADALALLIAVTFDPTAVVASPAEAAPTTRGPSEPSATGPSAAGSPSPHEQAAPPIDERRPDVTPSEAAPNVLTPPALAAPLPAPRQAPSAPETLRRPQPPVPPARRRLEAGLLVDGLVGRTPRALLGAGLQVLFAFDRQASLSPAVRLTFAHDWSGSSLEPGGTADFTLDRAGLDLCVVRVPLGPVTVRGCGAAALGRLAARGSDTYEGRAQTRTFAILGATLSATVDLGARLTLNAIATVGHGLPRDAFAFSPQVFYRTPAVAAGLGFGLGVRFP